MSENYVDIYGIYMYSMWLKLKFCNKGVVRNEVSQKPIASNILAKPKTANIFSK